MRMWNNWKSHMLLNIYWCSHFGKGFGITYQAEYMYISSLSNSIPRHRHNRIAYIFTKIYIQEYA